MLKLKLQYSGYLMRRNDSLEKTLMLGKIKGRRREDNRGWDGWMAPLNSWTSVWETLRVGDRQGGLVHCSPWGHEELDTTERLNQTDCQRLRIPVGMSSENLAFIEFTTFSVSMKVHSCLCHLWIYKIFKDRDLVMFYIYFFMAAVTICSDFWV